MTLNLCYRSEHIKETMFWIMLQETVWALSNIQRLLGQVSIIKNWYYFKVGISFKSWYYLKLVLNSKVSIKKVGILKNSTI